MKIRYVLIAIIVAFTVLVIVNYEIMNALGWVVYIVAIALCGFLMDWSRDRGTHKPKDVYSRKDCVFQYCDDLGTCKKLNACRHNSNQC